MALVAYKYRKKTAKTEKKNHFVIHYGAIKRHMTSMLWHQSVHNLYCDICETQCTTVPNLVLVGPNLTILQITSYMTSYDAKRVCRSQNGDHVPNAAFDKEQHATK